jgi:hypothetical protein
MRIFCRWAKMRMLTTCKKVNTYCATNAKKHFLTGNKLRAKKQFLTSPDGFGGKRKTQQHGTPFIDVFHAVGLWGFYY